MLDVPIPALLALKRRRIEAELRAPISRRFTEVLGPEPTHPLLTSAIDETAGRADLGAEWAEGRGAAWD